MPAGQAAEKFLVWAETTTDRGWLVVLDDVRRAADVNGWWPPAGTSAAGGQVVVTTRLREAALARADHHCVEVGIYTGQEADSYLKARLDDRADTVARQALARDLGHLPLALAQAAAYIVNADISCADYRDRFATRLLAQAVPGRESLPDEQERIVTATWEMSLDLVDDLPGQVHLAGLARPVMYLASVLDPAGIPQTALTSPPALEYLTTYLPESAPDTDAANATPDLVDAEMVDEVLRVLHRYSLLLDHDRHATHREIRVHQLVQHATRENLASAKYGPELFTELAHTAADALLRIWPQTEPDYLGQILRANATALQQCTGGALCSPSTRTHPVLETAANSLGRAGQVSAAIAAHTALHETSGSFGPDDPYTLAARANLAYWRGEAGDAAGAAAALQELLADLLRVLGPHHPNTLRTRHNLATWRGEPGDAAGAAAALQELLADLLRVLGPHHPNTQRARGNLAYWRKLERGADEN
ncbi:hypothetical protein [Actinomadura citrea]|uniref:hypothetical protein n=1 Tax=Actinomadura citrea TaxID=46158 RepID=UPI003CE511B2